MLKEDCVVVGGGPAGLMAAEVLAQAGRRVALFDAMPSVGRKMLLAGKGGLNLTHSEPLPAFLSRYGEAAPVIGDWLTAFGPGDLRDWAKGLGVETFVGSSGRVFPAEFKAAPLMRAWVKRLRGLGVRFHANSRWLGFDGEALRFATPQGEITLTAQACLLAMGGASWPKLGSDGGWVPLLQSLGCRVSALHPSNCGFQTDWSAHMAPHFGSPLKTIALRFDGVTVRGEAMLTAYGIEGGAVYALSASLRKAIEAQGSAILEIDLKPDLDEAALRQRLAKPRGSQSLSTWLKKALSLPPAAIALLRECLPAANIADSIAAHIKSVPLRLTAPQPIAEAISTAGGLCLEELTPGLELRRRPGLFAAGEMLDWEAPTGGYLLTACFASGVVAARGMLDRLGRLD